MIPLRLLASFRKGPIGWYGRAWVVGVVWLTVSLTTFGQAGASLSLLNSRAKKATLAMDVQRNLMLIQVQLNEAGPFNFILDTGVSTSLITDPHLIKQLALPPGPRLRIVGVGEETSLEAFMTTGVRVELPGAARGLLNMMVLSEDVLDLSGYVGSPVHGILGADVFKSFVVELQPIQSRLILHNPAQFRPPRSRRWTTMHLEMESSKPYVTVPVTLGDSSALPLRLVLDTGAGHALSLETSSSSQLQVPSQRLRSQLGRGLNGFINGYLGRVASLQLGRYQLTNLLTSFPDDADVHQRTQEERNGNLGFELLKRFTTIIDYTHNQLLLRPNEHFTEPFEHDMCGIELLATGPDYRNYLILKVQPDSPAALAKLLPGDQIVAVNLLPAANYSLTQLNRLLHAGDGRQLLFMVRRADGELHATVVRLKRQI